MSELPTAQASIPASRRRRWLPLVLIGATLLALSGVGGWLLLRPDPARVVGAVILTGSDYDYDYLSGTCLGRGGYDDIRGGAPVAVTGAGGRVVAMGTLGTGKVSDSTCRLPIDIDGVPRGEGFYGVEVSHRGIVRFAESDLIGPEIRLGLT